MTWSSLLKGFTHMLYQSATSLDIGYFQVHNKAYQENEDFYATIPYNEAIMAKGQAHGLALSPRKYANALISHGNKSVGVKIQGLDPTVESKVTNLHKHIKKGKWLGQKTPEIVVGPDLWEDLDLSIGSEVILLGQASNGSIASGLYTVKGLLHSISSHRDKRVIYLNSPTFNNLFFTKAMAHEIAIGRLPADMTEAQGLTAIQAIFPDQEVKSWRQLKANLSRVLELINVTIYFNTGFLFLALGGLLFNMNLMTVYDRHKEFGTMRAVGMNEISVFWLMIWEAVWLAIAIITVSTIFTLPLTAYLEDHGFNISSLVGEFSYQGLTFQPIFHANFGLREFLIPATYLALAMVGTAIYPAKRAASTDPLTAMKGGVST